MTGVVYIHRGYSRLSEVMEGIWSTNNLKIQIFQSNICVDKHAYSQNGRDMKH
jgi:hypothetical protein